MTVMPSTPQGGFELDFDTPFQPKEGPPDVWTATIGGNALECFIVKDSLTIRMGKDDPFPVGQADTGTATFEIRGDPLRWATHQSIGWNTNAFTGAWTDAPRATTSVPDTNTARYEPSSSPDWSSAELAGKTFLNVTEAAINTPSPTARGLRAEAISHDVRFDVWRQPGVSVGVNRRGRYVARYFTANPWNSGGVLLGEEVGPWVDYPGITAYVPLTLPQHAIPDGAGWVQWRVEVTLDSTSNTVYRINVQSNTPAPTFTVSESLPDTFEAGEQVVIKRNGLTVWTGWVTDESRDWSQSTGSVSLVNAAGPRRFYQSSVYAPAPGDYTGDPGHYLFPPAAQQGYELGEFVAAIRTIWPQATITTWDTALWDTAAGGPGSIPIRSVMYAKGAELPKPMFLLDGAANLVGGTVCERRDGQFDVWGRKWYAGKAADPARYDTFRVTLNCDEIGAPVSMRKDASMRFTRWAHTRGLLCIGFTPDAATSSLFGIVPFTVEDTANITAFGPLDFNIDPMLNPGPNYQALWNTVHGKVAAGANIEQVDQWIVRREFVDDTTWTKLLTASLGWPVRITNLPAGLMRDGADQFDGYLWGWELRGTEEIALTLIDERVFG